jgi:hypothetical protein
MNCICHSDDYGFGDLSACMRDVFFMWEGKGASQQAQKDVLSTHDLV